MESPPNDPGSFNAGFHFAPPRLTNQPPSVFGSYSLDNSPVTQNLGNPMFGDDVSALLGEDGMDNGGDPKRRRIARACDMCRKKKIKCDGKTPACTHCQNYKTECVFTQVEKKRNPPKGAKYIEGLENRLGRMESLLKLSGLLSEDDDGRVDLGTLEKQIRENREKRPSARQPSVGPANDNVSSRASDSGSAMRGDAPVQSQGPTPRSPEEQTPASYATTSPQPPQNDKPQERSEEEVEALSDMMCSLVTNNCGETRYIGSSSGFSIFSPKGIQWVNEKTGDASFQTMIQQAAVDDSKWSHWKPEVFSDIFARRVFTPLPPKDEALSLLKDYFANFNCMFPLFHEPTFYHLVEKHYSMDPYEGSGWWASLNIALAIAHRLRVMSNLVPQEEDQKAWGYLKNALAVQTELTLRNTDLLSVQALLGMALFLQGTPNPQLSFFLVAAAIRVAHSIGLHKRGAGFGLNSNEVEQRKRVFWIAYMLDRDICLRSGRPPIQDDDDMNVELPSEDPPDNIGNIPLSDGKGKVNLFRLMATFAIIESRVYKQLYSVKASKQSDGELLNTIGELDKELEDWKDAIPLDFRPEHEIKASHTPLILHVVVLHFAYYNCLMTIHRMSVHHGYWSNRLSNYAIQGLNARPLNPRVFSSAALCVSAARASIHLLRYIPQGDFACVWLVLYYPVSSLVTLFANILQNPQDTRARSDLKLMNHVVSFLSMLCAEDGNASTKRALSVCTEFERIARIVLDRNDKEAHSRRKRKTQPQQENGVPLGTNGSNAARAKSTERPTTNPSTPANRNQDLPRASATPRSQRASVDPSVFGTPNGQPNDNFQHFSSVDPFMQQQMGSVNPLLFSPQAATNGLPPLTSMATNGFGDTGFPPGMGNAMAAGGMDIDTAFQQPFVPQDLWQMPMTFEWDWADMVGDGLGGVGMGGGEHGQE